MAAIAACPYRPVKQREALAHEHRYLIETKLSDGTWLQDCSCEHRRRVQKGEHNEVVQVFEDGMVEGGGSLGNAIFFETAPQSNKFIDRWAS